MFFNYKSSPNVPASFFRGKRFVLILTKKGWATLSAIFSQTHPVTLVWVVAKDDASSSFPAASVSWNGAHPKLEPGRGRPDFPSTVFCT
jgi:hypothetical protein